MTVRYIYNTPGTYVAFMTAGHLFAPDSEWIGFLANGNEVYNIQGIYLGFILDDDRVVRSLTEPTHMRLMCPIRPIRPIRPLRPLRRLRMPRLPNPYIDVFEGGDAKAAAKLPGVDLQQYDGLLGAKLFANDGQYLGTVSRDKHDSESISNQYGQYGGRYGTHSIFNQYGQYGSKYSVLSPFSRYSTTPPSVILDGQLVGQLSVNTLLQNRIDTEEFIAWLTGGEG